MTGKQVRVELPYGKQKRFFELDEKRLLGVFSPGDCDPAKSATSEVIRSLENPIGTSGLRTILRRNRKVAIAVDDNTRATPVSLVLPALIEHFGLRREDVQVIVALGTHRKMTKGEMEEKYGKDTVEEYEFVNHTFDEHDQLKIVGEFSDGAPVWMNRSFLNADARIGIGNIVPHFSAGWSGGSKIVLPGLAGEEAVGWMHYVSAMERPNALGLVENSGRMLMDWAAKKVRLNLIVDTVLNRREEIVKVFSGNHVEAHRKGVEFAKRVYNVDVPERADITVSSSYPADIEFWQAQKGLYSADVITKKGGGILLLTPCAEGISAIHKDWSNLLEYDAETLADLIRTRKVNDLAAASFALCVVKTREAHNTSVVSDGISYEIAEKLGFKKFSTLQEAIEHLSRIYGDKSRVAVLSHGGDTCPVLKTRD
jgi:nickel-dependent lactate racemase